jgi:translation initiation factor IF-3
VGALRLHVFSYFPPKTQEVTRINKKSGNRTQNQGIVNEDIRAKEVMVIGDDGEKLGVIPKNEAIQMAYDKQLDLVVVAPGAKPPVAKFMDYNKYRFDQQKKAREAKKKQTKTTLKELRLSPKIDTHDFETKLRQGRKFLEKGDKLKISIRFRGREMAYTNQGREVMLDFAKQCEDIADIESRPKQEGRTMHMMLGPKKDK